jgi:hypothetical protein
MGRALHHKEGATLKGAKVDKQKQIQVCNSQDQDACMEAGIRRFSLRMPVIRKAHRMRWKDHELVESSLAGPGLADHESHDPGLESHDPKRAMRQLLAGFSSFFLWSCSAMGTSALEMRQRLQRKKVLDICSTCSRTNSKHLFEVTKGNRGSKRGFGERGM